MSHTLAQLRSLSEADLISEHDRLAHTTHNGVNYYLNELARRDQNKQTELMLKYAKHMFWLTIAVTVLTGINVVAVLFPLILCH